MGEIDYDGGHFGFCSIKKSLKGVKVAPAGILIWTIWGFQKANKTLYNPQYHVQRLAGLLRDGLCTLTNVQQHGNAMPQAQDITSHPATVYRHRADLSLCHPLMWNVRLE